VNRPVPNEVAPRLAAQTSQLSRQLQPSQSRLSQPVEMPAAPRQLAAGAETQPRSRPWIDNQTNQHRRPAREQSLRPPPVATSCNLPGGSASRRQQVSV